MSFIKKNLKQKGTNNKGTEEMKNNRENISIITFVFIFIAHTFYKSYDPPQFAIMRWNFPIAYSNADN